MADSPNRSTRVLVVDGDVEAGQQIQTALAAEGFDTVHTSTAAQGLIEARQHTPSLMIVDGQLAACSGYEFAQVVKQEHPHADIPVIFTSCGDRAEAIQESRTAGGLYCLTKPIDYSVVIELVDKALWMPHLIRRHIDTNAHSKRPRAPRIFSDIYTKRRQASRWTLPT